uniref:Small cardioactive peptide 1 n=1 Tax=Deroceras reticulatum TaxID=145610 RepID=A0A1X9WEF6_DERRE|nr:small cardioactive peptide 1 [Deroceras reticulatum]
MEMSLSRASLSLTVLALFVFSAEAMQYLAFPRMGRSGYLAFPRMGRSQTKSETSAEFSNCCGVGLKNEFVVGGAGKEELRPVCPLNSECCQGLREITDQKPDGTYYSMCVPDFPESSGQSTDVLRKLKGLIRK